MSTPTVNERTTATLTVAFKDETGAAATPSTVSYRIDELDTGRSIRSSTTITPASTVTITLTADDNAIVTNNAVEKRRITVSATYGSGAEAHDKYDYNVINLRYVT